MSERRILALGLATLAILSAIGVGCHRDNTAGASTPADVDPVEPVSLELPNWAAETVDEGTHLRRTFRAASGGCAVELDRWNGLPPDTGGPMMVASSRTATVAGREVEVVTTSLFQGVEEEVQAVFFNLPRRTVRIVLRGCGPADTEAVLDAVRVTAAAGEQ